MGESVKQWGPVARVAVDLSLPHLDRLFDYAVPSELDVSAAPGCRVRVRFAGQLRDGFIIERAADASVAGDLSPLHKLVSPEPVLTAAQATLCRAVADHYAGCFADVVRLAVPPRHAATERAARRPWPAAAADPAVFASDAGGLASYPAGAGFLDALSRGDSPRAAWTVIGDWTAGVAQAVAACVASGRGAIVVVPDGRDLDAARRALDATLGKGTCAVLHADAGPASRYRHYLAVIRGDARVVIGTRSAVFAPVAELGLIAIWDDGDDLHAEPRAPYPHGRDIAALRAAAEGAALLLAAHARSCEVEQWVERGWLAPIAWTPAEARRRGPVIKLAGDSDHALERDPMARQVRLPSVAFETIRVGLTQGPVLVQVPRAGYLVALACQNCRAPARCPGCQGPLHARRLDAARQLSCGWCGRITSEWRCPHCHDNRLRAPVVGSTRIAAELGRAFPGVRLVDSSADAVVASVDDRSALVVATPGGEPVAEGGYAAAVLLDAGLSLSRPDLRAGEESLRRWLNAVALVRPADHGGSVCAVGPSDDRTLQALVRLDPAGFAERELADRSAAGFPPAVTMVVCDGPPAAVAELVQLANLPPDADLLGPVELPPLHDQPISRLMVRASPGQRSTVVAALKGAAGVRSARKSEGAVRVRVDPQVIG